MNLDEGARAISVDELAGIAELGSPSPDLMPAREHGVIKRGCEHMRFGSSALIAGKDIGTGEEASLGGRRPQGSSFSIEFLKPLAARHTWGDTPRLVLDNIASGASLRRGKRFSRQCLEGSGLCPRRF